MNPFIYVPISLYFIFFGLFVQQGVTHLLLGRTRFVQTTHTLPLFTFGAALLCATLLTVILSPQLGFSPNGTRFAFFMCWLVAPGVGLLYARALAEHFKLPAEKVRWIAVGYVVDIASTLACGMYTLATGKAALFSHEASSTPSLVMQHIGGHFSPNSMTIWKTLYISVLVIASAAFFMREVLRRKPVDVSLVAGISLTAISLIAELVLYVMQWPMGFSVLPLANAVEIVRLTYLETLKVGRRLQQQEVELRRHKANLKNHLSALSHDVRTPLTSLKLMLSRLQDNVSAPDEAARLADEVEYMHIAFSNMSALFNLELSDSELTNRTEDIRPIIIGLKARFQTLAAARSVTVETSSESEPIWVHHDPLALEQSLGNLTYNAIVHARSRVAVTVSAHTEHVVIQILDDGDSVGHIDLHRLSDPAYRIQLEQRLDATGWSLCLAIAHELIRLHDGRLSFPNEYEGAICVSIELPIAPTPNADPVSQLNLNARLALA